MRGDAPEHRPIHLEVGILLGVIARRLPVGRRRALCFRGVDKPAVARRTRPTARRCIALLALICAATRPATAQVPSEIRGHVTSHTDGHGMEGARIDDAGGDAATTTDADGAFTLRGLTPGLHDPSHLRDRLPHHARGGHRRQRPHYHRRRRPRRTTRTARDSRGPRHGGHDRRCLHHLTRRDRGLGATGHRALAGADARRAHRPARRPRRTRLHLHPRLQRQRSPGPRRRPAHQLRAHRRGRPLADPARRCRTDHRRPRRRLRPLRPGCARRRGAHHHAAGLRHRAHRIGDRRLIRRTRCIRLGGIRRAPYRQRDRHRHPQRHARRLLLRRPARARRGHRHPRQR